MIKARPSNSCFDIDENIAYGLEDDLVGSISAQQIASAIDYSRAVRLSDRIFLHHEPVALVLQDRSKAGLARGAPFPYDFKRKPSGSKNAFRATVACWARTLT